MAGLSGPLLIVILVLVSGAIAYIGDIVGRRMGRRRLSLFGLRPRYTAIVISVFSGMLITIMTLTVAMFLSQDVKDGFFRVWEMRQRQAELAEQIGRLNESMKELEQTRQAAGVELEARQNELDQARELLATANEELKKTQEELSSASASVERAEGAIRRIGALRLKLERENDELQRNIEILRAQAASGVTFERSTPIIFGAGQPLDWQLFSGGRPTPAIRSDLDEYVTRLEELATRSGAGPLTETDETVIIRKPIRDLDTDAVVWFGREQVLDAIAERVHETSGGVIIRAFSVFNTHPGEPVRVDFELFRNRLVFQRGQILAQQVVDGNQSEPELMAALLGLLRGEVSPKARLHNVMPRPDPTSPGLLGSASGAVGDISISDLFLVIARLRSIGGPARVMAVAGADTWTIGPLEVELIVTPQTN